MRVLYVKSSERKNSNSVITKIIEENGTKRVVKRAIYDEGKNHIRQLLSNREKLVALYEDRYIVNKILDYKEDFSEITFEYIDGELLSCKYIRCIEKNDVEGLKKVIKEHMDLIIGNPNNICSFNESDDSKKRFGDLSKYEGSAALKVTNFEATPKNIIDTDDGYVVFDYEWVFDFCIPLKIILYQIFINAAYSTFDGLSEMISKRDMMSYLELNNAEQDAWNYFYLNNVMQSGEYILYENYEKKTYNFKDLRKKENEYIGQLQYIENLKQEWCQKNAEKEELFKKNEALQSELKNMQLKLDEKDGELQELGLEITKLTERNEELLKGNIEYKKYIEILEKKIRYLT